MHLISCAIVLLALQCAAADVNSVVGNNRRQFLARNPQQQQAIYSQRFTEEDETAYPAVGFRPLRPFNLPNGQDLQQTQTNNFNNQNINDNQQADQRRPDNLYSAPDAQQQQQQYVQIKSARLQQQTTRKEKQQQPQKFARQQQQQMQPFILPQQQGFAYPNGQQLAFANQFQNPQFSQQLQFGPQQFPNPQSQAARLTAEPEERETLENNSDDIEVNVENAAEEIPATRTGPAPAPALPPQATVTYFPANAINFVKPFPGGVAHPNPNPAATFIQYQPNTVAPALAKVVAASPASLPISAQYYASSAFLPSPVAFNSYTAFPRAAAPIQAW